MTHLERCCWSSRIIGGFEYILHLQPELDQTADGFGAADVRFLHGNPCINCSNLLIMQTHDLR